jgi:hypothetical protein
VKFTADASYLRVRLISRAEMPFAFLVFGVTPMPEDGMGTNEGCSLRCGGLCALTSFKQDSEHHLGLVQSEFLERDMMSTVDEQHFGKIENLRCISVARAAMILIGDVLSFQRLIHATGMYILTCGQFEP